MTDLRAPRSPEYYVLRVCERLGVAEKLFYEMDYDQQLRWLAFESLRQQEELQAWWDAKQRLEGGGEWRT